MREHTYHLTRLSANMKLGGIPATTSGRSTCPDNCSLKENGCYGEQHPMRFHWDKVSSGQRGTDIDEHCKQIASLPQRQLWRMWQVGDMPGDGTLIDREDCDKIVEANRGRHGFGFSHYSPAHPRNREFFRHANLNGLTINLSAENLEQADEYYEYGVGPVVTLLPIDQTKPTKTPKGRTVIVCPATIGDMNCALCGICAKAGRKAIVGFPAHGGGKKKAEKVFFATVSH